MKLKVLELFGGIGACTKALTRLNIPFEVVDYVEIDKYAVKSYNAIYGTDFEPQDITTWDKDLDVDLIMHGSPCQDFSLAGKQAGGDENSGTRSSLMYETIRIVNKLRPKYVIWENVKNVLGKKHRHNFDNYLNKMEQLGYVNYYQVLNAKDYGIPQNRERVFTVSILNGDKYEFPKGEYCDNNIKRLFNFSGRQDCRVVYDKDGISPTLVAGMGAGGGKVPMFVEQFTFPQKQELKLRLKDILEENVDDKYYLSEEQVLKIKNSSYIQNKRRVQKKDYCDTLCARDWKDPKCVEVKRKYGVFDTEKSKHQAGSVYDKNGIAPTLDTMQGGWRQPCIEIKNATKKGYQEAFVGDSINLSYPNSTTRRGRVGSQISQTIQTSDTIGTILESFKIRKLTPKECWRLMGFNDEDFDKASEVCSNTQLYKQAGNSIVVNVLEAILNNLLLEKSDK